MTKLNRVKGVLGTKIEAETIHRALELVADQASLRRTSGPWWSEGTGASRRWMETAKRLVFDISDHIAAIRAGVFGPAYRKLHDNLPRTSLATVVSDELRTGASDP